MTDTQYVGVRLYFRASGEKLERFLRTALIDTSGLIAGVQMKYLRAEAPYGSKFRLAKPKTQFVETAKAVVPGVDDVLYDIVDRQRKITSANLEKLLHSCLGGAVDTLDVEDRRTSTLRDESYASLTIRILPYEPHDGIQDAHLTVPSDLYNGAQMTAYIRDVVSELDACYGFSLTGTHTNMFSQLVFLPITPWCSDSPLGSDTLVDEELLFYQNLQGQFMERLPKAYWGNILSPTHVELLGGEERIRGESGCHLVERWGSSLYLQLTESPCDMSVDQLAALNRFFEPARFPDSPEPVYP